VPNFKKIVPRPTQVVVQGGIKKVYKDADGNLVVLYLSGHRDVIPISTVTITEIDGGFSPSTQTDIYDGGTSGPLDGIIINGGNA
jgi:hypothetical protein